jgi:acetyl-CoA/propionyl-CoA carboxylase biotin carboxyl carrier protein
MKIAREMSEVAEFYDSAVRVAISAFGRGECFVERYLDRSRHVEAQVLADQHGNVIVVGTRDCSLQRRNQKLIEEAPAPYLTDEQRATIHASAKAICKEASYYGAGTVEYLVGADGVISFLEVNTRLQVEHPVTEETSGVDLVREQFRIAEGEKLRFKKDPTPRGHSFEFRINGEDPGRGFLPAPGTVTTYREPAGPGQRQPRVVTVAHRHRSSGAFQGKSAPARSPAAGHRQTSQPQLKSSEVTNRGMTQTVSGSPSWKLARCK